MRQSLSQKWPFWDYIFFYMLCIVKIFLEKNICFCELSFQFIIRYKISWKGKWYTKILNIFQRPKHFQTSINFSPRQNDKLFDLSYCLNPLLTLRISWFYGLWKHKKHRSANIDLGCANMSWPRKFKNRASKISLFRRVNKFTYVYISS